MHSVAPVSLANVPVGHGAQSTIEPVGLKRPTAHLVQVEPVGTNPGVVQRGRHTSPSATRLACESEMFVGRRPNSHVRHDGKPLRANLNVVVSHVLHKFVALFVARPSKCALGSCRFAGQHMLHKLVLTRTSFSPHTTHCAAYVVRDTERNDMVLQDVHTEAPPALNVPMPHTVGHSERPSTFEARPGGHSKHSDTKLMLLPPMLGAKRPTGHLTNTLVTRFL